MSKLQEEDLLTAFVAWVQTFENISRPVNDDRDLLDGIILTEIVNDIIDPKMYKPLRTEPGIKDKSEHWGPRLNRLKKLLNIVQRYYEKVIGRSNIDVPNCNAIAKEGDVKELMKLCSLIITLAVQSTNNALYIEKIQSLSEKSQEGLKIVIERVMNKLEDNSHPDATSSLPNEDEFLRDEHNKLLADTETLKRVHQALMEEHRLLRVQFDDTKSEKEELIHRLDELTQKLKSLETQSSHQSGRTDFLMKSEIDKLRQEIIRGETKRHETEQLLESQNAMINELTRRVEDLADQADEAARLKDQLDEYRHAADKLKKTENVIEKYKKKLEEGVDLRRTLKTLEEENRDLIERNRAVEEEYRKLAAFKTSLEQYKSKIDDLETKNRELIDVRNKYEYEYKHMRAKIEAYEMEKSRDMEKIELMEERLRELEFGNGGERLNINEKGEPEDPDPTIAGIGGELADAISGTTMTQLKLKINELERELAGWREGKPLVDESEIVALQHMLDDTTRMKNKLEKDLTKAQKDKFEMESKLARYEANVSNGTLTGFDNFDRMNSSSRDRELAEMKRKLRETQQKLAEKEKGESKSDPELESRIEKLEAEKEALKTKNDELTAFLTNLEEKGEDDFKTENIKLHRANADRGKKIEQLKELIKAQHEVIEAGKLTESAMQMEREAHKEEVARLNHTIKENNEKAHFEQNMIAAAWYDIGRRIQRDNVSFQRAMPQSWLGQQRRIQENQLKRR